jgi:hypothetical protein
MDEETAVLALPAALKAKGALALGQSFQWTVLAKALGLRSDFFTVHGIGTEGNLLGEGELVVHVA